jgi:hypothetical protein
LKKVLAIALFLCLTVPFLACYFYLHHQTKRVRKEVKHQLMAGIDKDELVLLKFTQEETTTRLRWKHSKEFEYNSQMYDVVETETTGDTTYYWCWWDHEETKLNQQLTALVTSVLTGSPDRKKQQDHVVHFYKSLYYSAMPGWNVLIPAFNERHPNLVFHLDPLSFPPPQPPPEKG